MSQAERLTRLKLQKVELRGPGTDLTVIFDEANAGFPCIDVARPHIEAIVERLIA